MISSLEVGARFTIVDDVSIKLNAIAANVARLDAAINTTIRNFERLGRVTLAGLERAITGLDTRFAAMSLTVGTLQADVTSAFATMTGMAVTAQGAIAGMTANLNAAAAAAARLSATRLPGAAAAAAGGGFGRGGGGGGGSGGRGFHGQAYVPVGPAHVRAGFSPTEVAGIGLGAGAVYALRQGAREELSVTQALMATGTDPRTEQGRTERAQLYEQIAQAARGTMFSRVQVATMLPALAGISDVPMAELISKGFLRPATLFGEVERNIGQGIERNFPMEASVESLARISHLLGVLDPSGWERVANILAPTSMTTGRSPKELETMVSMYAGSARALGLDTSQALGIGGFLSLFLSAGRAGAPLGRMFLGLIDPMLQPGMSARQQHEAARREQVMIQAGLIDPRTHRLPRDPTTGDPITPLLRAFAHLAAQDPERAQLLFRRLFDIRGARSAMELAFPQILERFMSYQDRVEAFNRAGGVQGAQSITQSTLWGAFQTTIQRIVDLFTSLGETTGPVTAGLQRLNAGLQAMDSWLRTHQGAAQAALAAAGGAGALAAGGLAFRAGRWLLGPLLGAGAGAAAGGAAAGAAGGGLLRGLLSRVPLLGLLAGAAGGTSGLVSQYEQGGISGLLGSLLLPKWLSDPGAYHPGLAKGLGSTAMPSASAGVGLSTVGRRLYGFGLEDSDAMIRERLGGAPTVEPYRFRGTSIQAAAAAGPPHLTQNITVNIRTETIQEIADKIVAIVKNALALASMHNSGPGDGNADSGFSLATVPNLMP